MDLTNILLGEIAAVKAINVETVLAEATMYPASGAFIDVAKYHRFALVFLPGALANQQVFQVQQATANNGTPKDVTGAALTIAANGDNKPCILEVDVAKLDVNNGYRYITLDNTGGATGDYCAILFLGFGAKVPVTQDANFGQFVKLVG
jgi:hypothetical protein